VSGLTKQSNGLHRLEQIAESLDNVSKAIRLSEADQKLKVKNWITTWLILPIYTLSDLKGLINGIKSANFTPAIPLLAGTFLSPLALFIVDLKWYTLAGAGLLIGYLYSFFVLVPKTMCDFNGGYFRIAAYAKFRTQEYEIFKQSLVHGDEFYFSSIPKELQLLMKSDESIKQIHARIDTFLNQEKAEMVQKIKFLEAKYEEEEKAHKKALKNYDTESSLLIKDNDEVHKAMGYVFEFIKATKMAIVRKTNKKLNVADLVNMIGAGISIYVIHEDHLKLKSEAGTNGDLPDIIQFDDETYMDSSYLLAIAFGVDIKELDSENTIISRRFPMKNEEEWIISFHVDMRFEKALYLHVENDILEVPEIYRMVHSICLLGQEQEQNKEAL
jgi:hypothetical protein